MMAIHSDIILKLLPHKYPFLLVDKVSSYKKGFIEVIKNVTINESFFNGHFPERPVFPGVLLIEAAAQSAALMYILDSIDYEDNMSTIIEKIENETLAQKVGYLASVKNFKFKHIVEPGEQLKINCQESARFKNILEINVLIRNENNKEIASGRLMVSKNEN